MCSSPRLFAAYHVLHRLLVPRHPPCALLRLISILLALLVTTVWIPLLLRHPAFSCQRAESMRANRMDSAGDISRDFQTRPEGRPYSSLQKGGDPAAGSPTATLLRLRPSHCARLRRLGPLRVPTPTSGTRRFHGVTGGVYKARERIHRGVADPRLLAIPASCGRVAAHNPNLDRLFAISAPLRVGDALYRPL